MTQEQAQKKADAALRADPSTLGVTIRASAKSAYRFVVANGAMICCGKVTL